MSTPEEVKARLAELSRSGWALSALTVAGQRGILRALAKGPRSLADLATLAGLRATSVAAIADVLVALGLGAREGERVSAAAGLIELVGTEGPDRVAADLISTLGALSDAVIAARSPGATIEGWRAQDPAVIRAQATLSGAITGQMEGMFRALPGLSDSLSSSDARFLDVGAGAGAVCIGLASMFPSLQVVGIEPSPVAAEEARRAIQAAGLSARIELREQGGEALDERAAYSMAYVAQMFMPDGIVEPVLAATARALRPGGWLLTGATALPGVDLLAAVSRWRSAVWGGDCRSAEAVLRLLNDAGLVEARAIPAGPQSGLVPIVARAPAS